MHGMKLKMSEVLVFEQTTTKLKLEKMNQLRQRERLEGVNVEASSLQVMIVVSLIEFNGETE
jgi:hypothetical protein